MTTFPYRTVWRLAAPNIASNLMAVSTMIAHLWIVAPFGAEASAAIVAVTRVNFLLMAASMALSVATTALVARAWGAEKFTDANRAATSAIGMSCIIASSIALPVLIFPVTIAGFFTDSPTALTLMAEMMRPMALLAMVYSISLTLSTSYRAVGNVVRPLKLIFVASVANIIAAYACTNGLFGLPAYGPIGVAYGALGSQIGIVAFYLWRWSLGQHEIKPDWAYIFNKPLYKKLIKVGLPAALEQYVFQIGSITIMALLVSYGTEAFVAYGIGINILSVCIVIGLAFGTAGAILSGQKLGAGNVDAARESSRVTVRMALLCMGSLAFSIAFFRQELTALFSNDAKILYDAQFFVLILALCQPLMAIEFAVGGTLRGAGDTRFPMAASMVGTIFSRIILAYVTVALDGPVEIMYGLILVDFLIKVISLLWRFKGDAWTKTLDHTPPEPLQSERFLNRTSIREYYRTHRDSDTPEAEAPKSE